jgi:hypothetical protein
MIAGGKKPFHPAGGSDPGGWVLQSPSVPCMHSYDSASGILMGCRIRPQMGISPEFEAGGRFEPQAPAKAEKQ